MTTAPPPLPVGSFPAWAVLAVREGVLPLGGLETVAECDGKVVLVGSGVSAAADQLNGVADNLVGWEAGSFQPARWARLLAPLLGPAAVLLLPDGPDGRDLGPRLAHELRRPFVAGVVALEAERGRVHRPVDGARTEEILRIEGGFVASLQIGCRGSVAGHQGPPATLILIDPTDPTGMGGPTSGAGDEDPEHLGNLEAMVSTMDLADAERIVAAGAGLGSAERLATLSAVGERFGAALGATRVLSDWGWVSHRRQIGTTGVAVNPRLYLAFGISGAVQHTAGLGRPDHIVAVNIDASCPMMAMADLAVVADAPAVLAELARLLGVATP